MSNLMQVVSVIFNTMTFLLLLITFDLAERQFEKNNNKDFSTVPVKIEVY